MEIDSKKLAQMISDSAIRLYKKSYSDCYEKYLDKYGADIAMSRAINESIPVLVEYLVKEIIELNK